MIPYPLHIEAASLDPMGSEEGSKEAGEAETRLSGGSGDKDLEELDEGAGSR